MFPTLILRNVQKYIHNTCGMSRISKNLQENLTICKKSEEEYRSTSSMHATYLEYQQTFWGNLLFKKKTFNYQSTAKLHAPETDLSTSEEEIILFFSSCFMNMQKKELKEKRIVTHYWSTHYLSTINKFKLRTTYWNNCSAWSQQNLALIFAPRLIYQSYFKGKFFWVDLDYHWKINVH